MLVFLVILSLGLSAFVLAQGLFFRHQMLILRTATQGALTRAIYDLERLQKSDIALDVHVNEEIPVHTKVPLRHTLAIPINAIIPVRQDVRTTVSVDVPGVGLSLPVEVTVPLAMDVPVDLQVPVFINKNIPISTTVPLELSAPVVLNLGETEIADSLERLRTGLITVDKALTAVQTNGFSLHSLLL
jgi:hypothetical protein